MNTLVPEMQRGRIMGVGFWSFSIDSGRILPIFRILTQERSHFGVF